MILCFLPKDVKMIFNFRFAFPSKKYSFPKIVFAASSGEVMDDLVPLDSKLCNILLSLELKWILKVKSSKESMQHIYIDIFSKAGSEIKL